MLSLITNFFDVSNAFDNLWRPGLFKRLRNLQYPKLLHKSVRSYCQDRYATMQCAGGNSFPKDLTKDVPKGRSKCKHFCCHCICQCSHGNSRGKFLGKHRNKSCERRAAPYHAIPEALVRQSQAYHFDRKNHLRSGERKF